jgi:hypothetical protein
VLAATVLTAGLLAVGAAAAPDHRNDGSASPQSGELPDSASQQATDALNRRFGFEPEPGNPVEELWAIPTSGWTANEEYREGTYIWTDQVFDDRGGATYTYPSDGTPYKRNAADLVEVRAALDDAGDLVVGARVNTLLDPAVPIVAIGVTDPATAGQALVWPGAGVKADGVRWVLLLDGRTEGSSSVTDLSTGAVRAVAPAVVHNGTDSARRPLENTLTMVVEGADLGLTAVPSTFELLAVAGAREPSSDDWYRPATATAPPVFDVAFFAGELFDSTQTASTWETTRQSELISSGDVSAARRRVDLTIQNQPARHQLGQAQTRIYRPSVEMQLGEGIEANSIPLIVPAGQPQVPQGNRYLGLFVPYTVWVPADYAALPKPLPLIEVLHGLSQTHLNMVPEWISGAIDVPALAIFPLGFSDSGYYQGPAELDVIESLEDAKAALPVDATRVLLSGLSMGGIGTYNVATHRPDLFAGAVPVVGPGSGEKDFLWPVPADPVMGKARAVVGIHRMGSFGREVLENALNVPFRIFAALKDPLSTVTFQEGDVARWEELGYDYQHALFVNRGHEFLSPYVNTLYHQLLNGCVSSEVPAGCDATVDPGGRVRDDNPSRVVYKAVPFHWYPDLTDKLVFNGAYWVSDMQLRSEQFADDYALIDVTTDALASKRRTAGAKVGPEPRRFEPTSDDYLLQARFWADTPATTTNHFDLRAANLASVTLDVGRMRLRTDEDIAMTAVGDGMTAFTFVNGDWASGAIVTVLQDGVEVARGTSQGGSVTLELTLGAASNGSNYIIRAT